LTTLATGAPPTEESAIIGIGLWLPGARTPSQLWRALRVPDRWIGVGPAQPTTEILVRELVSDALADASLPAGALAGTATGIYVCTTQRGDGARHAEQVAQSLGAQARR
jgi:acyl transferase domain-containing protein